MSEPREDLGPIFDDKFKAFIMLFAFALSFVGIIVGFIALFITCMMETHVFVINIAIELSLILLINMRRIGRLKNPLYYRWRKELNDK